MGQSATTCASRKCFLMGEAIDGVRILSEKPVMLMTSDHLGPDVRIPLNIRALLRLITPSADV